MPARNAVYIEVESVFAAYLQIFVYGFRSTVALQGESAAYTLGVLLESVFVAYYYLPSSGALLFASRG